MARATDGLEDNEHDANRPRQSAWRREAPGMTPTPTQEDPNAAHASAASLEKVAAFSA